MTQYIGPNKVAAIVKEEGVTTPAGGDVIQVFYENAPSERMSRRLFDLLATEAPPPGDFNYLQTKKFSVLIPAVIDLLLEYDLKVYEVGTFGKKLIDELQAKTDFAAHYLLTGETKTYVAGTDPFSHRSMWDIEVIVQKAKKEASEEPKQEDGGEATAE